MTNHSEEARDFVRALVNKDRDETSPPAEDVHPRRNYVRGEGHSPKVPDRNRDRRAFLHNLLGTSD